MREKDSSGIFRIMYLHIVLSEVVHGYGGGFYCLTCASTSPRAQPTREVKALVVNGCLSSDSLYAAQPGTAPPRVTAASRKSGLSKAVSLRKGETGALALVLAMFLETGVTPKADAARQEVATTRLKSFIVTRVSA